MKTLVTAFGLFFAFSSFAQNGEQNKDELQALKTRLQELNDKIDDIELKQTLGTGTVKSYLNDVILIGGFFETGIEYFQGEDTDRSLTASSHVLGLNIGAQLGSKYFFNTQILTGLTFPLLNPHNNPRAGDVGLPESRDYGPINFGAVVPQGYLEVRNSEKFNLQAGLGYAPFGYALQQRELVLFKRRNGPQLLNATGGDGVTIASAIWSGVHLYGELSKKFDLNYNLYTFTPLSKTDTLGVGGRISKDLKDSDSTVGVSFQNGRREQGAFQAVGVDIDLQKDSFGLIAEAAANFNEGGENPWSFYLEPYYSLDEDKKLYYVALDYLSDPLGQTFGSGVLQDPFRKWIYAVGMNWLPEPYIRYRAGLSWHDYVGGSAVIDGQNRDYQSFDLSLGLAF